MANNRIFYACQAVAMGTELETNGFREVHGVQSVGINTTFNLEQVFELGQIEIYENIEGVPDIEVTIEKVLDGYPLLYRLATLPTGTYSDALDDHTLVARAKNKCSVVLGIYADDRNSVSGVAPVQVYMSGMYLNNVSYTLPTDGNCTESVTLVGNSKQWLINTEATGITAATSLYFRRPNATTGNPDYPQNLDSSTKLGGIQRRENIDMQKCIIPSSIYGVAGTGVGNNWDAEKKCPKAHIQSITISTDLGREDILELGKKLPYYRAPNYPVEVTSEFEVISVSGDFINAMEEGDPALFAVTVPSDTPHPSGNNTREEPILVRLTDGTGFYLGKKNRLSSVTYGGGDAGGGNATSTYSFVGYNELVVVPPIVGTGVTSANLLSGSATIPQPTGARYGED
jgi:hypothetical protein